LTDRSQGIIASRDIRGVIFDIDGVVLDSMGFWNNMPSTYVAIQGIVPPDDLINTIFTMSIEQGIAYLRNKYNIVKSEQEIMHDMTEIMGKFYFNEVQAKPGILRILNSLRDRGIPCAIATASPRAPITAALTRLGLIDYFDAFYTCGEAGHSKHSPTVYQLAAEAIGTEPEHTIVFEDSHYAMETARKAGFVSIGIYDAVSEHGDPGLKDVAEYFYESLDEVEL